MADNISVTGFVTSDVKHITTSEGLQISSFRLASQQRRFDRAKGEWVNGDTNWYSVTAFRQLASNVAASVGKGDRVVVTGRLRTREWQQDGRTSYSVEIEADAVGHDLAWGTSSFARVVAAAPTAETPQTGNELASTSSGAVQASAPVAF